MARFSFCKVAVFAALAFSTSLVTGCASRASEPRAGAREHAIVVVGIGKVHAKPDVARIQIGVESRAATVEDANRQNTEQMNRLLGALKGAQIADKDLRTSNYSINFERSEPPTPVAMPMPAPRPGGAKGAAPSVAPPPAAAGYYRVSNNVQATVRDLTRVGTVLDAAVAVGANNVWGVSFELEDDAAVAQQMREKAIADATQRATALATLGRVKLGEVISISEVVGGGRGPVPQMASFAKGGTPVESGELSFEGQIEVVYALER